MITAVFGREDIKANVLERVLFLDFDGVLNRSRVHPESGLCGIDRECVAELNKILRAADPAAVLTTTWIKLVDEGHISLRGAVAAVRELHRRTAEGASATDSAWAAWEAASWSASWSAEEAAAWSARSAA